MLKCSCKYYLHSFALLAAAAFPCLAVAQEADVELIAAEEVREAQTGEPQATSPQFERRVINLDVVGEKGESEVPIPWSEYWIGVQLEEPSDLLKSQLKLEDGIVVTEVFDDSPAKKAGIETNDILLRVGEKPIVGPTSLIQAIEAAKEAALEIELLRGGERKKISVTPIKRPKVESDAEPTRTETRTPEQLRAEMNRLDEALKALEAARGSTDRPLRFTFVHPQAGITSGGTVRVKPVPDLPDDMTITVTKEGGKPAKIVIKREGNTWETTDDKLGNLTDEIRGYVNRLLPGHAHSTLHVRDLQLAYPPHAGGYGAPPVTVYSPPATSARPAVPVPPAAPVPPHAERALPNWPVPHPAPRATNPYAVPATPAPPTATRTYRATVDSDSRAVNAKLEAILKKLDALGGEKFEAMERELKKLRSEVDDLRKDKK